MVLFVLAVTAILAILGFLFVLRDPRKRLGLSLSIGFLAVVAGALWPLKATIRAGDEILGYAIPFDLHVGGIETNQLIAILTAIVAIAWILFQKR